MNLYNLHDKPESLHGHKRADKEVGSVVYDKYKHDEKALEDSDRKKAMSKYPTHAYQYAMTTGKPFPEGEDAIAKNPSYALRYAMYILKGPFPKGEDAIAKIADESYQYSQLIGKPFPKGEANMDLNSKSYLTKFHSEQYVKKFPERAKHIKGYSES